MKARNGASMETQMKIHQEQERLHPNFSRILRMDL